MAVARTSSPASSSGQSLMPLLVVIRIEPRPVPAVGCKYPGLVGHFWTQINNRRVRSRQLLLHCSTSCIPAVVGDGACRAAR